MGVGKILQFPRKEPTVIERLDASVRCMHRLQAVSDLPAEEIRAEALGARLGVAGLRDAMHDVLRGATAPPRYSAGIEHVWKRVESLVDQVAIYALCSYEESNEQEENCAVRIQLRAACQSTLLELHHLRSLLAPANCAEKKSDLTNLDPIHGSA